MGESLSDEKRDVSIAPCIELKNTINRIHKELKEISSDIFKMYFTSKIEIKGKIPETRCVSFTKFSEALREGIRNGAKIVCTDAFLLETNNIKSQSHEQGTSVPILIYNRNAIYSGVNQVLSFKEDDPFVIELEDLAEPPKPSSQRRLSSSDYRILTRSLFEDALSIREQARLELSESRSLFEEIKSRSLAEIPVEIEERGELLNGLYINLHQIGEGHNGIVWKASEPKMGRDVALKMLHPKVTGIDRLKEFYSEVLNHGRLIRHPNIVQIYTIHDVTHPPFYVMEFIEGQSLEDYLRDEALRKSWPSYERSMEIVLDILEGLSHAHDRDILHGDIKPGNIMIDKSGVAKLSDFGCAKFLTSLMTDSELSNLAYESLQASETFSAPELLKKEVLEHDNFSSDLFSLGLVMYLLFGKTHPFLHSSGLVQQRELLKRDDYPAPSLRNYNKEVSDNLVKIVSSLLEKNPDSRPYKKARELLNDLKRLRETEKVQIEKQTINIGITTSSTSGLETTVPFEQIIESDINEYLKKLGKNIVFDFFVEDNQGTSLIALENTQKYKTMGIDLIIGHGWSSQCQASLDYVNENNMLMISASSTSPILSIKNDRLFRTCTPDTTQAPILAQMWKTWGAKAVLTIQRADAWGDILCDILSTEMQKIGVVNLGSIMYAGDVTEFSSHLENANDIISQAIERYGKEHIGIQFFSFAELRKIQTQAADYPNLIDIIWMTTESGGRSQTMLNEAGEWAVKTRHFSPFMTTVDNAEFLEFDRKYSELTGYHTNFYVAAQYDACWLLVKAILETGSTNAKDISEVLIPLSHKCQGLTGLLSLDENGDRLPYFFDIWGFYEDTRTGEYKFGIFGSYNSLKNEVHWDHQSLLKHCNLIPPSFSQYKLEPT